MRLVHTKLYKPSSKNNFVIEHSKVMLFVLLFCIPCLSVTLLCVLFQLGDDWPLSSFVCYLVIFFTFPYVVIGQVRCLIISNIFTDRSKAVLPLWIIMLSLSCYRYAFMHVCSLVPCGHLLGKG